MFLRSNVRLLRVLVIIFPILTGAVATLHGVDLSNRTQMFPREDKPVPPGFLLFSSMELSSVNLSIQIIELNVERGRTDKVVLMCDFTLASPLTDEQTIGFQFPYVVEQIIYPSFDVEVLKSEVIHEVVPPPDGGKQTDVSIVYFRFKPKPDVTHYSFSVFYSWSGLLSRTDYATYKFVMPFARDERALHGSIGDLIPGAKVRYLTQSEGDDVSLLVNAVTNVKEAYPAPSGVMGAPGYSLQMLTWDLSYGKSIFGSKMPASVDEIVAYFELGSAAEEMNRYLYEAGIYTGLGVSLLFSGIYEALKALEESKNRKKS